MITAGQHKVRTTAKDRRAGFYCVQEYQGWKALQRFARAGKRCNVVEIELDRCLKAPPPPLQGSNPNLSRQHGFFFP